MNQPPSLQTRLRGVIPVLISKTSNQEIIQALQELAEKMGNRPKVDFEEKQRAQLTAIAEEIEIRDNLTEGEVQWLYSRIKRYLPSVNDTHGAER